MAITALPPAPLPTDTPAVFSSKAFALAAALSLFVTEANALATYVDGRAIAAAASAAAALVSETNAATSAFNANLSAVAAATSAGAPVWVSGSTYVPLFIVRSPVNGRLYSRITGGAGTLDPSADPTNWKVVSIEAPNKIENTTATITLLTGVRSLMKFNAQMVALLPASPAEGDWAYAKIRNGRSDNEVDPNGSTIEDLAGRHTLDNRWGSYSWQFLDNSWRYM
jgi:hypothetical protein